MMRICGAYSCEKFPAPVFPDKTLLIHAFVVYVTVFCVILPVVLYDVTFSMYFKIRARESSDIIGELVTKRTLEVQKAKEYFALKELPQNLASDHDTHADGKSPWVAVGVITVKRHVTHALYKHFKPEYVIEVAAKLNQEFEKFTSQHAEVRVYICNAEGNYTRNSEAVYLSRYMQVIQRNPTRTREMPSAGAPVDPFESERLDYAFCLAEMAKFGAKYTLILQDDAVVHEDFFTNLRTILDTKVERRYERGGIIEPDADNLALVKLYFPEKWQGYSWDLAPCLELLSIGSVGGISLSCFYWMLRKKTFNYRRHFKVTLGLCSLFCVLAAIVVGRQNLLLLREKFGVYQIRQAPHCCIPAVLYTRNGIDQISEYLQSPDLHCSKKNPLDVTIGKYVDHIGMDQILVVPNMVDHIGIFSTLHKVPKNPRSFFPN